ncbi:MAG: hypothetical protein ACP5MD_08260, partial [Verrucomicrobiia bacterium]
MNEAVASAVQPAMSGQYAESVGLALDQILQRKAKQRQSGLGELLPSGSTTGLRCCQAAEQTPSVTLHVNLRGNSHNNLSD